MDSNEHPTVNTGPLRAEDLAAVVERMMGLVRALRVPGELSLTSVATLARLERGGPFRLTELAGHEGVTQPAMTQIVARLSELSLVERGNDPVDGRAVLVALTEAGRALLTARRAARASGLRQLVGQLDEADQQAIAQALPALARLTDLYPSGPRRSTAQPRLPLLQNQDV